MSEGSTVHDERQLRLEYLEGVFRGAIADENNGESFDHEYFQGGGCLRNCLNEIEQLSGPSEYDQRIMSTRQAYMDVVLTRPNWRNRVQRKALLQTTENAYVDAVVAKIAAVVDAQTPEEILRVRQIPTLTKKTSFNGTSIELRDIAANHLFVLTDTALQEHASRRALIREHKTATWRARVVGNRVLHLCVAAGIFAASFVPELGVVPTPDEFITQDIETTLKVISAVIFGLDAPELIRLQYLKHKNKAQTKKLNQHLAASEKLSDLALRISYGSPRYGSSVGPRQFTGRFGTGDPKENIKRLEKLDKSFADLHNDPGGRPYTGAQAIGYAARFLLERPWQIESFSGTHDTVSDPREQYLALCREIITEDLARMKRGLTITRYRKQIMKAIGIIPALLFPAALSTANEARTGSEDVNRKLRPSQVDATE